MSIRNAILALVIIALAAGGFVFFTTVSGESVRLVPAWQLLEAGVYSGRAEVDPFVTWSPDSRSLLLSAFNFSADQSKIYAWRVGEEKLEIVTEGSSPNFLPDGRGFIYLKRQRGVFVRDLASGEQTEIAAGIKKSEFWQNASAVVYDSALERLTLRLVDYTLRYTPGTDTFDMNGAHVHSAGYKKGDDVVDACLDPKGLRRAIVVEEEEGCPQSLQIARAGSDRGKEIACSPRIGAVDWSPDGLTIAYGDQARVVVVRPEGGGKVVVAAFPGSEKDPDVRYVSRLSWSPNGCYLAALLYVSSMHGDYPIIYVLDMSGFKWD